MSSSAPKRRLDVRQETPRTGKRAAQRRRPGRRTLRPSPAMVGAFALILAGFGSAVIGGQTAGASLSAGNYQSITAAYTGDSTIDSVDVSRSFDRNLDQQGKAQAAQTLIAQAALTKKIGKYSAELQKNQWVIPVTGYHITTRFGQVGSLWASGRHTGLDMAGPSGSTIVAIASGTVTGVGYEGSYGNRTELTLLDGTVVWYCHQSRIVVKVGERVLPGQVTGYTGSTGNSTGPHLHLEIHPPGTNTPIDPYAALIQHGVRP